ncbi:hypothetical protein Mal4_14380 [Maioricimonas rarisocia]|uniref:ApeA N-terminal domain-containing protein n=1 Tax=Maioricimonas rarisocia TaxID=2528026 RepID=A0A517Z3R4_9PLAN|nr:hypothetical protein [Maioricimonas rarisocia]QDU37130.1 hypothetical protein Mal4_14380 [Maioricimonas rarisocia]
MRDSTIAGLPRRLRDILEGELAFPLCDLAIERESPAETFRGSGFFRFDRARKFEIQAITRTVCGDQAASGRELTSAGSLVPDQSYYRLHGHLLSGEVFEIERISPALSSDTRTKTNERFWQIDHDTILSDVVVTFADPAPTLTDDDQSPDTVEALLWPVSLFWPRESEQHTQMGTRNHRFSQKCWLEFTSSVGNVFCRRCTDDIAYCRLTLNDGPEAAIAPVAQAFSFLMGHVVVPIAIFELRRPEKKSHQPKKELLRLRRHAVRRKSRTFAAPFGRPRGSSSEKLSNEQEKLLTHATDYFTTPAGRDAVDALHLCWDTADADVDVSTLITCTAVEVFATKVLNKNNRLLSPSVANNHDEIVAALHAIKDLRSQDGTLPGFSQDLTERISNVLIRWKEQDAVPVARILDYLRKNHGHLVAASEVKAWERLRNPTAHGQSIWQGETIDKNVALKRIRRVETMLIKLLLNEMGYCGRYFDTVDFENRQLAPVNLSDPEGTVSQSHNSSD